MNTTARRHAVPSLPAPVRSAPPSAGVVPLVLLAAALLLGLPVPPASAVDLPQQAVQDVMSEDGLVESAAAAAPAGPSWPAVPGGLDAAPPLTADSLPGSDGADGPHGPAADGAAPDSGQPPADVAATQPEPGEDTASTIDLLDEDNRLDHGAEDGERAEGDLPAGEDVAAEHGADEPGATPGAEAAAVESDVAGALPGESVVAGEDGEPGGEPDGAELFPTSPGIEKQKAFWIEIFTRYNSHQGVLHDGRIALPVYESIDLTGMRYRAQLRHIRNRKRELIGGLRSLAAAMEEGRPLNNEQVALLAKLPAGSSAADVRGYSYNVRFQRGLADRFRQGLIRSGALMAHMREILARHGVPEDLMYLPHVESSFNNATLSKAGAAGIWQFTRGTGRMYMTLRYEVDERLDPIIATEAAAKYLRRNYEDLGTWPLAITAYNHGPRSLQRITRRMGTRDLGVLIREYNGRLFKFASKNFYASFLAAREVALDYERWFGPLEFEPTLRYEEVELPWYLDVAQAADVLDVSVDALRRLNPALRHPVWSGAKYIPPGYSLRIPSGHEAGRFLAAIPEEERHDEQKRSLYVRVARGDTLYDIGRRHGISWRDIALANNISSVYRLRPGQRLILPWDGATPPPQVAAADNGGNGGARPELLEEHVVERIPVDAAAPWKGGQPRSQGDVIAEEFQELRIVRMDAERKMGEIVAAYGETVGAYSEWAGVTATEVRRINGMSYRSVLRPGETYVVPLDAVTAQQFEQRRVAFHRDREQNFFAEYDITEKVKVEVQRGQSPWNLAQQNNVPMWLFYKENPDLLRQPLRVGMEVILPIVRAGGRVAQ